jgi:hypothetical protein
MTKFKLILPRKHIKPAKLRQKSGSCQLLSLILAIWLVLPQNNAVANTEQSVAVALPPPAIAQWYKPQNKRQVWLHLMFRLGQTSQAIMSYGKQGDTERMAHWAGLFAEKYRAIPMMVPQWRTEVDETAVTALETGAANRDFPAVRSAMKKIRQTCKSCHGQYKASTVAIYRSADFSKVEVKMGGDTVSYRNLMKALHRDLTALKIAREDGQPDTARHFSLRFREKLAILEESCSSCHRDPEPKERILGAKTQQTLTALHEALKEPGKTKKSGHLLGTLGYTVCGRCHGIHRNSVEIKKLLK